MLIPLVKFERSYFKNCIICNYECSKSTFSYFHSANVISLYFLQNPKKEIKCKDLNFSRLEKHV